MNIGLCKGRHDIPGVTEYIFPATVNPIQVYELEVQALECLRRVPDMHINLYVTGLTVALIAAINVAVQLGKTVTLLHYDRETGAYYQQELAFI